MKIAISHSGVQDNSSSATEYQPFVQWKSDTVSHYRYLSLSPTTHTQLLLPPRTAMVASRQWPRLLLFHDGGVFLLCMILPILCEYKLYQIGAVEMDIDIQPTSPSLHSLVLSNSLAEVQSIITSVSEGDSVNLNEADPTNLQRSPLIVSICSNPDSPEEQRLPMVKLLTDCTSVDVNQVDENGHSPLYFAITMRLPRVIEFLLSREDLNVNAQNIRDGNTALHVALLEKNADAVDRLMQLRGQGLDVGLANAMGDSPLHLAVKLSHVSYFGSVVNWLVLRDVHVVGIQNELGQTAMHLTVLAGVHYSDALGLLVHQDISNAPEEAETAKGMDGYVRVLHFLIGACVREVSLNEALKAVDQNGNSIVHLLARHIPDVPVFDSPLIRHALLGYREDQPQISVGALSKKHGMTALHMAVCLGADNLVQALLRPHLDPNVNARTLVRKENTPFTSCLHHGDTALHLAIRLGRLTVLGALRSRRDLKLSLNTAKHQTPIDVAIGQKDNPDVLRELWLFRGLAVRAGDMIRGRYVLQVVREAFASDGTDAIYAAPPCQAMIEQGFSRLHLAVLSFDMDELSRIADDPLFAAEQVNKLTPEGSTALHLAVRPSSGLDESIRGDMVEKIMDLPGISLHILNRRHLSVLQVAMTYRNNEAAIDRLLQRYEQMELPDDVFSDSSRHLLRMLFSRPGGPALVYNSSLIRNRTLTVLQLAVLLNDESKFVELLKNNTIDVNERNARDGTVLHVAAMAYTSKVMGILLSHKQIDVNVRDAEGRTPLDILFSAKTVKSDVNPIVKKLLRKMAFANLYDLRVQKWRTSVIYSDRVLTFNGHKQSTVDVPRFLKQLEDHSMKEARLPLKVVNHTGQDDGGVVSELLSQVIQDTFGFTADMKGTTRLSNNARTDGIVLQDDNHIFVPSLALLNAPLSSASEVRMQRIGKLIGMAMNTMSRSQSVSLGIPLDEVVLQRLILPNSIISHEVAAESTICRLGQTLLNSGIVSPAAARSHEWVDGEQWPFLSGDDGDMLDGDWDLYCLEALNRALDERSSETFAAIRAGFLSTVPKEFMDVQHHGINVKTAFNALIGGNEAISVERLLSKISFVGSGPDQLVKDVLHEFTVNQLTQFVKMATSVPRLRQGRSAQNITISWDPASSRVQVRTCQLTVALAPLPDKDVLRQAILYAMELESFTKA